MLGNGKEITMEPWSRRERIAQKLNAAIARRDEDAAHDLRIDLDECDFEARVSNDHRIDYLVYGND